MFDWMNHCELTVITIYWAAKTACLCVGSVSGQRRWNVEGDVTPVVMVTLDKMGLTENSRSVTSPLLPQERFFFVFFMALWNQRLSMSFTRCTLTRGPERPHCTEASADESEAWRARSEITQTTSCDEAGVPPNVMGDKCHPSVFSRNFVCMDV